MASAGARCRRGRGGPRGPGTGSGTSPRATTAELASIMKSPTSERSSSPGPSGGPGAAWAAGGGGAAVVGRAGSGSAPPARFERLLDTMAHRRGPHGCPWDRAQTRASLKPFLIEEAYEVLEAIETGQDRHLREELGDLLLQGVFHRRLAGG